MPEVAAQYNNNKDAVDHGNKSYMSRLGESLPQEAQGHKWWLGLFWRFFDGAVA